ncbi:MAG: FkbM family methyltransferase [Thermomicrobiales bacterium]
MNEPNGEWPVVACAGFHFYCSNAAEFERICQDVFAGHEYAFDMRVRHPYIIDAGAHVGVATHYFKHRHPHARVLAIEANPATFSLLRRNISHNGLDDVHLRHAALAPEAGEITFYTGTDGEQSSSWGDSAIRQPWHGEEATSAVRVPAITLSSLLTERVDVLKLDIEGLETAVLAEAAPQLARVRRIVLEFHGTRANPENDIERLVGILDRAGFTVDVYQFGSVVPLGAIQRDDPFWLIVRAERLSPWQRLRRR